MLILGPDFETTGTDTTKDRIVQIGLILYDTDTREEKLVFDKKVNPGMHIPAGAVAVHGIGDSDVVGLQGFEAYAKPIVGLLSRADLIVGHNIEGFDLPLLMHELVRAGADIDATKLPATFDTMLMGRECTDDGKIPNLGELCWAFDVPYDPNAAHDAIYDIRCTINAFMAGVDIGFWKLQTMENK